MTQRNPLQTRFPRRTLRSSATTPGEADRRPSKKCRSVRSWAVSAGLAVVLAASFASAALAQRGGRAKLLSRFDLKGLTIDRDEIYAGGPGKDGIPSLTRPETLPVAKAPYRKKDRIVAVTVDERTRGYPLAVLNWHEVINDVLADEPIAVIYCPLCDSVSVIDRRIGDKTLEFGVSGLLYNSNVLLYDRQTNGLWSQLEMKAVSGPHVGKSPKHLPFRLLRFETFAERFPKARVVGVDTGHKRDYARNPYRRYFATQRTMFPVANRDIRLDTKDRVIGVKLDGRTRAYPLNVLRKDDDGKVVEKIGEAVVTLVVDDKGNTIRATASKGRVVHTFWFAWVAFYPKTSVYNPSSAEGATPSGTDDR